MTAFLLTWKETGWPHENIVRMALAVREHGYIDEPRRSRTVGGTLQDAYDGVPKAKRLEVLGEAHLRRILKSYARYYNGVRTHRSLNKDAPVSRSVQRAGVIRSRAILGGLHHHYSRI